jgi:DNA-directed RNA polymerase subunit N (RpoN/RPB10)
MIIPIRCITCGKVIADYWEEYNERVAKKKINETELNNNSVIYKDASQVTKTIEGEVLDELDMRRYCCRRMFLSQPDILSTI